MIEEDFEVLRAIFSRTNEIVYDDVLERLIYNAVDDHRQSTAFSVSVDRQNRMTVESQILTKDELKQLQTQASCNSGTLFDTFTGLKECYDRLLSNRMQEVTAVEDVFSSFLMTIDHMRSPNVYMKHLRQWTNELEITGRVLRIPHRIFILIEGRNEHLKRFIGRLKSETVDIDSRGRPCKERLSTQLAQLANHPSKFSNFEKIDFHNREELFTYLKENGYEDILNCITHA